MDDATEPVPFRITRRHFLVVSAATAGVLAASTGLPACGDDSPSVESTLPNYVNYGSVPETPMAPPPKVIRFFTSTEAGTLDALTARILPGDAADPGAHEAGVVYYIDNLMATTPTGSAQATYDHGPFAKTYVGPIAPPPEPGVVFIEKEALPRYGDQSKMTPKESYRRGLQALDESARARSGLAFVDLTTDEQDLLVAAMSNGAALSFTQPSADSFFKMVRQHVIEGTFSDPVYGGNRDMVGWKLVGYPGAWRAYNDADLQGQTPLRPEQDIEMLHGYEEGEPVGKAIQPVSGSNEGN
jgi:gluconate 2-dehydrogenase gamma chain